MTAKRLEIFVIVVIIALIGIVYAFKQRPNLTPVAVAPTTQVPVNPTVSGNVPADQVPATVITYAGQNGKNALELLETNHQVQIKQYSFGDEVVSIDGITPDSAHFWAMYVNGNFSQVGASAYATKSTDTIRWEVDTVANNK